VAFAHYVTDGITPAQQATSQLRREMEDLNTQLKQMTAGVKSPLTLPQQLKVPTSTGSADEIATENERINKVLAKQDEARKKATTDLAEFQQRVNEDTATRQTKIYESIQKSFDDMMKDQMEMLKRTNQNTIDLVASFTHLRDVQHEAFGPSEAFTEGLDKLGTKVLPITNDELKNFEDRIKFVGPTLDQARAGLQTFGDFLKNDLGQVIVGAFQGGGNILQSAGSAIGGFLSGAGSTVGRALSTGVSKVFGSTIGSAIGSVIPGLGTALGGLVGGLFGKLFNDPEKQVNPIRQAFVDAAGGLAALNQRAHEAGVTLDHLLDAKTPEAYKAAIDELNVSLQFQDQAMKTLDDTVKKYGFTIEELGPALQRQNLDKQAQDLYQDFKVLTGAGIATDTVLGRMGDSINTFVHDALRTGTEIPAAMAPMLQRMVEMGTLTDENGNSITDLSAAGVTFSETMTQGFQKIVDAVQKLTDAITRGLGTAIDNIPDPHVTGTVDWQVNAPPGFDPNDSRYRDFPNTGDMEVVPMAGGGSGRVTSPTLFFSRGNEDFAFSGEGQSFSGGSSSSGDIAALSAAIARLPRTISRSIRDALVGMNG
jgi:hypothetical protein